MNANNEPEIHDHRINAIIKSLSPSRFETYLVESGYDKNCALELYRWNIEICAGFYAPIQAAEVGLRNRINDILIALYGDAWWEQKSFLDHGKGRIEISLSELSDRLKSEEREMVNGQVVAGLSFGFWVGLLAKPYFPLIWSRHLDQAFPRIPGDRPKGRLKRLRDTAHHVLKLRNRISHHEPLIRRDISLDYKMTMDLLDWICPSTRDWITPISRIPALLRQKPRRRPDQ